MKGSQGQFPVRTWSPLDAWPWTFQAAPFQTTWQVSLLLLVRPPVWALWTADPLQCPHMVYHPERVPHLSPQGTVLDKAQPLSSSCLYLDCESSGGESDSRPLRSPLWPPGKSISTFVDAHWQTCRRLCFWRLISQRFHFFPVFIPWLVFLFHFILRWHNGSYSVNLFNGWGVCYAYRQRIRKERLLLI